MLKPCFRTDRNRAMHWWMQDARRTAANHRVHVADFYLEKIFDQVQGSRPCFGILDEFLELKSPWHFCQ